MSTTCRNRFIQILNLDPTIQALSENEKTKRINRIVADVESVRVDGVGIFDEPVYDPSDEEELDLLSEAVFGDPKARAERIRAIRKLYENKEGTEQEVFGPIASDERIRAKQIELKGQNPEHWENIEPTAPIEVDGVQYKGQYGRTPLHEAIAMKDLASINRWCGEGKFLDATDNNGNTPYDMAFQDGYEEAMLIIGAAMECFGIKVVG